MDHEPVGRAPESADLGAALRRLGREAGRLALGKLDAWQRQAREEGPPGSVIDRAVIAALRAGLPGPGKANPVRAALGTVWAETGPAGRTAFVGVLILVLVTAPVLLLVALLLAGLIAVALRMHRHSLGNPGTPGSA